MQHPSKTRTWANDDDLVQPAVAVPSSKTAEEAHDANQERSPPPPKKSKVNRPESSHQTLQAPVETADQNVELIGEQGNDEETEKSDKDVSGAEQEGQPKSDADWLRSKTNRLLGLLDEEEQAEQTDLSDQVIQPAHPTNNKFQPIEEDSDENEEEQPIIEEAAEVAENEDYDANVDLIRTSGRLFLRNLAYDAKEEDLEEIFAPFGKIEEVSFTVFFFPLLSPIS